MKSSYKKFALIGLSLTLINIGCTKNAAKSDSEVVIKFTYPKGDTLAQVGGTSLSLEFLKEDFLSRQGTFKGAAHLNTEEKKKEFVTNEVLKEAMFQEAVKLGYFEDPAVQRDVKKIVVQKLIQKTLETSQNEYKPTEEEMKTYYDNNQNLFSRKEAFKLSYINVPYGDDKAKAKKIADGLHKDATTKQLNGNTNEFIKLALKYMTDTKAGAVKVESGHADFQEQAMLDGKFGPGVFEKVKQTNELGKVTEVIAGSSGYLIMMNNGYRKDVNESFDESKEKISKKLAFDNRGKIYEKYTDELRNKYNVKVYEDKITKLSEGVEIKAQANNQAPASGMNNPAVVPNMPAQGMPAAAASAQANTVMAPSNVPSAPAKPAAH